MLACRAIGVVLIGSLIATRSFAQDVTDTSYVTSVGEKVLRIECTIPEDIAAAWKLFATSDGLRKWAAPVVSVNFQVGGQILTNYDKT
jgi:hypothetical protein